MEKEEKIKQPFKYNKFSCDIPRFPSTLHLPYKPNLSPTDAVAENFINNDNLYIFEKVDGANCGVMLDKNGEFIVRNREHILKKGFKKDTPAKLQFRPLWNWIYDNKNKFEQLNDIFSTHVAVYAEWTYALHGISYDNLPDYFMPFDLYVEGEFFDPLKSYEILKKIGFHPPALLHIGKIENLSLLDDLCNAKSAYSTVSQREGIYIKEGDGKKVVNRYKMIRSGYIQGCNWSNEIVIKQKLEN